ncbi:MAG TPA: styrene monooxygenase/indole monooxygenase family protein [Thermoanaerobaculia bacterium]|nr:styrene monooxygenase/indole monooxygenase family protein [Thermoanaerobaculia bacterium]
MRRIAIIGSGIAGLVAAHGLRREGYEVTLYSDRTAEQWLHESRPTGTAARFELALAYERELGLNHWDDVAPRGEGVFLTFCPKPLNPLVRLCGRMKRPFQAGDLRLQCHRWMRDFEAGGGRLIIEPVSVERLDAISAEHELTIVAAGRADLSRLFEPDPARCVYSAPQRNLAMIITTGGRMGVDGVPFLPVKFELLGTDGEVFFVPYFHKDRGPSWNILFEPKPGSRMDRFAGVKSGEDAVAIGKEVIAELFPWNREWVRDMELADPLGWLIGRVTPTVRKPVGRLPSGRLVTPLGDTAISYDPIAAQGANSGVKQARHLVASIVAREDRAFDERWMTETFDAFYAEHGRQACTFSNLLLEPITPPAKEILIAQYGSDGRADNQSGQQKIADAFFSNFNDPRELTGTFLDMKRARDFISATTGRSWIRSAIGGRAAIARDQISQKVTRRM